MPAKFAPKVSYSTGPTVLTLTRFMRVWTPAVSGVGGARTTPSGVSESFEVGEDQTCEVTLVFDESEYSAVINFIRWAQRNAGTAFTFWFNQSDNATSYTCYLDNPKQGEIVRPTRVQGTPHWEQALTLRSSNGTPFRVAIT